jgi:hypothetical protein
MLAKPKWSRYVAHNAKSGNELVDIVIERQLHRKIITNESRGKLSYCYNRARCREAVRLDGGDLKPNAEGIDLVIRIGDGVVGEEDLNSSFV